MHKPPAETAPKRYNPQLFLHTISRGYSYRRQHISYRKGKWRGTKMIYAYTRETPGGETQKAKLKRETALLEEENADILIIEKPSSQKKKKYKEFRTLLNGLRPGDMLIIPSFDRISHSPDDFAGLLAGMKNRGVTIRVLNMGTFDDSPEGKALCRAVNAFAEFEKAMIVERTQEKKAKAREDITFREGRPRKYSHGEIASAVRRLENGESYNAVSKDTGISKSTLQRARAAEKAKQSGDYLMTDAEIRAYEAKVAGAEQMTLEDLLT